MIASGSTKWFLEHESFLFHLQELGKPWLEGFIPMHWKTA